MKIKLFVNLVLAQCFFFTADGFALPKAGGDIHNDVKTTLGFVPTFMKDMPDYILEPAWGEMKNLQMNPKTALSGKQKGLIGLAVSSQIPCTYCIYTHTQFAKLNGASKEEIAEAVGIAAGSRHWSTYFSSFQTDVGRFRKEIDRMTIAMPQKMLVTPIAVVDAESARKDMTQTLGFVPEFFNQIPPEAAASAWLHFKNVDGAMDGAISPKDRNLIALAVSSQIPCTHCIIADTSFAKKAGASQREINEAVAMSSLTRLWSTYLKGMQVDGKVFRKDIDTIVRNARRGQPTVSR